MLEFRCNTESAAFEGDQLRTECARILRAIAHRVEDGGEPLDAWHTINDLNGNDVGRWRVEP